MIYTSRAIGTRCINCIATKNDYIYNSIEVAINVIVIDKLGNLFLKRKVISFITTASHNISYNINV